MVVQQDIVIHGSTIMHVIGKNAQDVELRLIQVLMDLGIYMRQEMKRLKRVRYVDIQNMEHKKSRPRLLG